MKETILKIFIVLMAGIFLVVSLFALSPSGYTYWPTKTRFWIASGVAFHVFEIVYEHPEQIKTWSFCEDYGFEFKFVRRTEQNKDMFPIRWLPMEELVGN